MDVQKTLDDLKVKLHLADWTVEFLPAEFTDDDTQASVRPSEGRKLAVLRVCEDFQKLAGAEQIHALTHELVHLHFAAAGDIIRLDLLRHLAQSTYDVIWQGFKRQIEYGVDGVADAVAPLLAENRP